MLTRKQYIWAFVYLCIFLVVGTIYFQYGNIISQDSHWSQNSINVKGQQLDNVFNVFGDKTRNQYNEEEYNVDNNNSNNNNNNNNNNTCNCVCNNNVNETNVVESDDEDEFGKVEDVNDSNNNNNNNNCNTLNQQPTTTTTTTISEEIKEFLKLKELDGDSIVREKKFRVCSMRDRYFFEMESPRLTFNITRSDYIIENFPSFNTTDQVFDKERDGKPIPQCEPGQVHHPQFPISSFFYTEQAFELAFHNYIGPDKSFVAILTEQEKEFLIKTKKHSKNMWIQRMSQNTTQTKLNETEGRILVECAVSDCDLLYTVDPGLTMCNWASARLYTPGCYHKNYVSPTSAYTWKTWSKDLLNRVVTPLTGEETAPWDGSDTTLRNRPDPALEENMKVPHQQLRSCLSTKNLFFIGDSTLRGIQEVVIQKTGNDFQKGKFAGAVFHPPTLATFNSSIYYRYWPLKDKGLEPHTHIPAQGSYLRKIIFKNLFELLWTNRGNNDLKEDLLRRPTYFILFGIFGRALAVQYAQEGLCKSYLELYRKYTKEGVKLNWSWSPSLPWSLSDNINKLPTDTQISAVCKFNAADPQPVPLPTHVKVIVKSNSPSLGVRHQAAQVFWDLMKTTTIKSGLQFFDTFSAVTAMSPLKLPDLCGCHFYKKIETTERVEMYGPVNEIFTNNLMNMICDRD